MASKFLVPDREQTFLEAMSYREVLGLDHLVWTVIGVVEQLDLSELYARYEGDPGVGGRPAFDPAMLTALLVFGYCEGKRSSRALEGACGRDWAYRAICGDMRPDHATIARFRVSMDEVLAGLFTQVLAVCAELGMGRVGVVAVDGTKMEAAASKEASHSGAHLEVLEAQARRMLAEAADADRRDDESEAIAQTRRVANQADRVERIRRARAVVAEAMGRKEAEEKKRGKAIRPVGNVTDPDSRLQKTRSGFVQGYNAQAVVSADQIVVAAAVTSDPTDVAMLEPMLRAATQNLAAAGVETLIEVALADAGYWSEVNAGLETRLEMELLIATTKSHQVGSDNNKVSSQVIEHRDEVIGRVEGGELCVSDAAQQLGISRSYASQLLGRYRNHGTVASTATVARQRMQAKLSQTAHRDLYRQRGWRIEGSFAHTKTHRSTRRFQRRGLTACDAEWKLINLAGNIGKIHRHTTRPHPPFTTRSVLLTRPPTSHQRPTPTRPCHLGRSSRHHRIRPHPTR